MADEATPAYTVLVDTREQVPYTFAGIVDRQGRPIVTERIKLPVCDYGIRVNGKVLSIAIERKTKTDLYGSLGKGRERLKREFEKGVELGIQYMSMIVEDTAMGLLVPPPYSTRMDPKIIVKSIISWSVHFNLHVHYPGPRKISELWTYRLLEFFARQYQQ